MYTPTLDEVRSMTGRGNLVPVHREIDGDLETPVSAYLKIARPPYSFLLESVEGGERIARYSFIGTEPKAVIKTGPNEERGAIDPLLPVEEALSTMQAVPVPDLPRFTGGAVGYISYDAVRYFERLPSPEPDPLGLPESVFMLATDLVVFDHLRHKIMVVSHARLDGDVEAAYAEATERIDEIVGRLDSPVTIPQSTNGREPGAAPAEVETNMSRERFEEMVDRVKEYIVAGDVIQTVVAHRFSRPTTAHPFQIYGALRNVNPSPYMYYLDLDDFHIVGASPEMLVQVEDGSIQTHPIAGTFPRGANEEDDLRIERELLKDEKERAEHIMLVDLGRNDIGRVSKPGSVVVNQLMDVERYSHLMHLVSNVTGKLRDGYTNFDALRSCFPAGTLSGAPKIRAMEIIAELEPDRRGPYGGAVGYFDLQGNMDTAITIRTLVVKDGIAYTQAGGGIVYDSVPAKEYEETLRKAAAVLRAMEQAEGRG